MSAGRSQPVGVAYIATLPQAFAIILELGRRR